MENNEMQLTLASWHKRVSKGQAPAVCPECGGYCGCQPIQTEQMSTTVYPEKQLDPMYYAEVFYGN